METTDLLLILFVAAIGLVALFAAFSGGNDNRAAERLEMMVGKGGGASRSKDSSADLLLKEALNASNASSLLERLTPEVFRVSRMFEQADVSIKPSALFAISLALGAIGMIASAALTNIFVAPVGGIIMASLPFLWLMMKRNSRLAAFAAQLPDAMELTARALRAGHSLAAGMHVVAEEMPAPISKEFGRVYDEQNLGIALEDALRNMTERVPNLDLRFFVTAVAIQRQTGGDLAEILDRIGYVIRERYKILGQVKALTAEGRLSGIVLIALPIGLFLMMLHLKYDYVELLWKHPLGKQMSIFAIVSMLIGSYVIKKIVDIKV